MERNFFTRMWEKTIDSTFWVEISTWNVIFWHEYKKKQEIQKIVKSMWDTHPDESRYIRMLQSIDFDKEKRALFENQIVIPIRDVKKPLKSMKNIKNF